MSKTPVLDHGYVELVESWGSDERIIEAARMSTGKGFKGWGAYCPGCGYAEAAGDHDAGCEEDARVEGVRWKAGDEKLLRYLWTHKHATPFEMAGLVIEVKAPIFVFREWHRHRTQSYNEMSARYIPLPDENYVPTIERVTLAPSGTKQADSAPGASAITDTKAAAFLLRLHDAYVAAERVYSAGLGLGVPKELARLCIPVGRYSRMRASANLRNWLAFLTLRMDPAAQWEIQEYARAVGEFIAARFPRTWELFVEGRS